MRLMLMLISLVIMSFFFSLLFSFMVKIFSNKVIMDREQSSPFECGFSLMMENRLPFSLRFFIVALIFLIFDLELLLLFPFLSNVIFSTSFFSSIIFFLFLMILSFGLFYEWNSSMLEWI